MRLNELKNFLDVFQDCKCSFNSIEVNPYACGNIAVISGANLSTI